MAAGVDKLIQEAATALKAGRKDDARRALDQAIALDDHSEQAWLWMSGVIDNDEEQEICLENVLAINPTNQKAQKGLDAIRAKRSASAAKPAAPFVGPRGESSPSPNPTPTPASAPSPTGNPDWGEWSNWANTDAQTPPPTSVEWGSPAPAAKSDFPSYPSTEEYDSWMAGLSLGKGNTASTGTSVPAFDLSSDFDNAPFNSPGYEAGPFSSPSFDPPPDTGTDTFAGAFSGPFQDPSSDFPQEADPFGLNKRSAQGSPTPSAPSSEQSSFSFKRKIGEAPALAAARQQSDAAGTFEDYAGEEGLPSTPKSPTSPIPEPPPSNAALFTTMDSSSNVASPSAYFAAIPEEIRASSVAGPLLLITLLVLAVLNVGSIVWLLGNLRTR
jgi:hypothetical protein